MTANQIEYWKLQEQKRHNLVTEGYEGEYKKAQTQYTYASLDLIGEQIKTEGTKQALNLASAGAQQASAELSYERINTEMTQQDYNRAQYDLAMANVDYVNARTEGQSISNRTQNPEALIGDARSAIYTNGQGNDVSMALWGDFNRFGLPVANTIVGGISIWK